MLNLASRLTKSSVNVSRSLYGAFLLSIALVTSETLYAVADGQGLEAGGPLSSREIKIPLFPQVPKEESVDPVALGCDHLRSSLKNMNPLPLVDWINVSNLPSFFEPTIRSLLKRDECYNDIDSIGQYDLGVQPWGFFSSYDLHSEKFKLTSFGTTIDGGVALWEHWVVGGGIGYWHSSLDWGKHAAKNSVNSLYLGPYIGYIFEKAYIDLSLIGVYNLYNTNKLFDDDGKGKKDHHGWDVAAKLEGGWDYEWTKYCGDNFFVQPNGELSYVLVIQDKMEEKSDALPEEIFATVESRNYNFLRSKLGVTLRKEYHHREKGILIPSLSLGWVLMQPLSSSKVYYTPSETEKEEEFSSEPYPSSNQGYVGLKVQAINKRAMMLTLGAEAYIANFYPVYLGTIRFEWNW
jgi:hypothetical protein